jgi:predicted secreted protein
MNPPMSRRLGAVQAANDLLIEHGIDQHRPVDVFALCEELGLWLVFKPMAALLGAFVPAGSGGVLITTLRSPGLQRYTVAHEIGHWALEHVRDVALDDEVCVLGAHASEREQLAQVFAAHLLIPPPLAFEVLGRIGVGTHDHVSPMQAYAFSREVGVSYEAGVRHLANLQILNISAMRELLRARPIDLKTQLAHGRRPNDARADVWAIDERWDEASLSIHLHDEVVVSLPENRTTGYRWALESSEEQTNRDQKPHRSADRTARDVELSTHDFEPQAARGAAPARDLSPQLSVDLGSNTVLGIVHDEYVPGWRRDTYRSELLSRFRADASVQVGATGRRVLTLEAIQPGVTTLRLVYASPYERDSKAEGTFQLETKIEKPRVDASVNQLLGYLDPYA